MNRSGIKALILVGSIFFTINAAFDSLNVPFLSQSSSSTVVAVATAQQLLDVVASAVPGQTIMIENGNYTFNASIRLRQNGIVIRGKTNDPRKVVLRGQGFGTGNTNEELIKIENSDITIAYLTIRDVRANGLKIQSSSASNLLVHNVYFVDICERPIKSPVLDTHAKNGVIRHCFFEQITPITSSIPGLNANGDYIAGMDMMYIDGWKIHDNLFKNIRGMNGEGRAAIFLWNNVKNCIVERNTIVNCDRGIALGNASNMAKSEEHVKSVIVRNNFIASDKYDAAIEMAGVDSIVIANNSIYKANLSGSRGIRFINYHTNVSFQNNILHGRLIFDSGESGIVRTSNLTGDYSSYFKKPIEGDLHLTALATSAIGKGVVSAIVTDDYDLQPRTETCDIGADQLPAIKIKKNNDKYQKKTSCTNNVQQFYTLSGKKIESQKRSEIQIISVKEKNTGVYLWLEKREK